AIERRGESAQDAREGWIEFGEFGGPGVVRTGKASVIAADREATASLKLRFELVKLDAQVRPDQIVFAEPGETREFLRDVRFFGVTQPRAFHEGARIVGRGKLAGVGEKRIQVVRAILQEL